MYLFESDRLGFRSWKKEDIEPFAKMCRDPEVMEHFPAPLTREQTEAMIDRLIAAEKRDGYTFWAVEEKYSSSFIGFIGLTQPRFEADFTPCTEIGWRLAKQFWNKGYATEGAKACLDYGFRHFGAASIYSFTTTTNTRSEHVMQKIGMSKVGEFDHPNIADGHPLKRHVLYQIHTSING